MSPEFCYSKWACNFRAVAETIVRKRIMIDLKKSETDLYLIVKYTSNNEIAFLSGSIEEWELK